MSAAVNIAGHRFGRLVALRPSGSHPREGRLWECVCDCGATKVALAKRLRMGHVASCGCLHRDSTMTRGGEGWVAYPLNVTRKGARDRGYSFTLTREQVRDLVVQPCAYCGGAPSQKIHHWRGTYGDIRHGGIDRVDNARGYEPDNCVPCCGTCNIAKRTMSRDEFIAWARRVVAVADSGQVPSVG